MYPLNKLRGITAPRTPHFSKKRGVPRSEILKKALEMYVRQEKRWELIYKWGEEKAKELKIKDEEDIERLIQEFRKEYI